MHGQFQTMLNVSVQMLNVSVQMLNVSVLTEHIAVWSYANSPKL